MAWDPRWDTAVHHPHAPRVGAGKPRASATTGRVEGAPAAAATNGDGPALLASAVQALEGRTPSDGDPGGVRRLLQQDSDPLIVDQGRTRATERAAAKPGQGAGGATHTPCLSSTWHRGATRAGSARARRACESTPA